MRKAWPRELVVIGAALVAWGLCESAMVLQATGREGGGEARPARLGAAQYEQWARAEFARRYPGEKPLNWAIGETARRFHRLRPMGEFVLSVTPGKWGNDCSDFVECIIDEALGVGARMFHGRKWHVIGYDPAYFDYFAWEPGVAAQAGDVVRVRHSPWYAPYPEASSHVGVVGDDGQVYDFTQIRSWPAPRYGRNSFEWFVRHSRGPGEVSLGRLKAQYRYRIEAVRGEDGTATD